MINVRVQCALRCYWSSVFSSACGEWLVARLEALAFSIKIVGDYLIDYGLVARLEASVFSIRIAGDHLID